MVPSVKIQLDKERTLILDMTAMQDFEQEIGKSIFHINLEEFAVKDLVAIVWACLLHEDESLTPRQVGRMIYPGNIPEISEKINDLMTKSMPEPDKKKSHPAIKK